MKILSDESSDTISGSGTSTTSINGISWSMNDPGSDTDVRVHNDHIHCSKLDGNTVTWETNNIIISSYTNLNFTVKIRKTDDLGNEDYIKLQYSLNGGSPINIVTYINDIDDDTIIGGDINSLTGNTVIGDSIKLYIKVYQDDDDEN